MPVRLPSAQAVSGSAPLESLTPQPTCCQMIVGPDWPFASFDEGPGTRRALNHGDGANATERIVPMRLGRL